MTERPAPYRLNPAAKRVERGLPDSSKKLLASIVAISAIRVLKAFMNIDAAFDVQKPGWLVGVHLVFVVSTLVLAPSDRWGGDRKSKWQMASSE